MDKDTKSKSVGMVFKLLTTPEQNRLLYSIGEQCRHAENECWRIWQRHDPQTYEDQLASRKIKNDTGAWPKLIPYFLKQCPDGRSPYLTVAAMLPGISSRVVNGIDNHVRKLYGKGRMALLNDEKTIPHAKTPRIRLHKAGVKIRRSEKNPEWFQVGLQLLSGEPIEWIELRTCGATEFTCRWLTEYADSGEPVCGAVVSQKKRRSKTYWQIALARPRYDDEIEQTQAIRGRKLIVYAPIDQEVFLYLEVAPIQGRPWRTFIESNDMIRTKLGNERRRASMGRNYAQSREVSACRGRGRGRAIRGKQGWSDYENRVRYWIENRSRAIVNFASDTKCEGIVMENLVERDASKLRLGSFPYYQLIKRTAQKAKEAGIKFAKCKSLDELKTLLSKAQKDVA